MLVVVADSGPIHYLVLIGHADILLELFEKVIIPSEVRDELTHPQAPEPVRTWIREPPPWLEIHAPGGRLTGGKLESLDEGERAALILATR